MDDKREPDLPPFEWLKTASVAAPSSPPLAELPMLPEVPELGPDDLFDIEEAVRVIQIVGEAFREMMKAFAAGVRVDAFAELDAAIRRVERLDAEIEFERRYQRQRMRKQRRVRRGR